MNVTLKQSGNDVDLYINKSITTVFEGKNTDYVAQWINKNFRNIKVCISL